MRVENSKILVPLGDGRAVEAVFYSGKTLCLSSQVGCALGCGFCASGRHGLMRNLRLEEFGLQLEAARAIGLSPETLTVSGMGEPIHNLENLCRFVEQMQAEGLPVSVTTTGGAPEALERLMRLPLRALMLSLHAGRQGTRRTLMPRAAPLSGLLPAFVKLARGASRRTRRKLGINYLLLEGVNDSLEEFEALLPLFEALPDLTLHLLEPNPVPGSPYKASRSETLLEIFNWCRRHGIHVRRANASRRQPQGGCGTLVLRSPVAVSPDPERMSE